jgi:hypothetical protein
MLTWSVCAINEEDTKIGYAIYRPKNKEPIFQGYMEFDNRYLDTDAGVLEILGLVIMSRWDPTMYVHDLEKYITEYTEDQIDWLNSQEAEVLYEMLNSYEEQFLDELDEEIDGKYEWRKDRLYYKDSNKRVLEDVSSN